MLRQGKCVSDFFEICYTKNKKRGRIGFMMRVEKLTKGSESIEKFKSMVNIPASVLRGKVRKKKLSCSRV